MKLTAKAKRLVSVFPFVVLSFLLGLRFALYFTY